MRYYYHRIDESTGHLYVGDTMVMSDGISRVVEIRLKNRLVAIINLGPNQTVFEKDVEE